LQLPHLDDDGLYEQGGALVGDGVNPERAKLAVLVTYSSIITRRD